MPREPDAQRAGLVFGLLGPAVQHVFGHIGGLVQLKGERLSCESWFSREK